VAVNCCVRPCTTLAVAGVIAMDVSAGGLTVKEEVPLIPLYDAVIVVAPVATLLAKPLAAMVATDGAEDIHVATEVKVWVVLLL